MITATYSNVFIFSVYWYMCIQACSKRSRNFPCMGFLRVGRNRRPEFCLRRHLTRPLRSRSMTGVLIVCSFTAKNGKRYHVLSYSDSGLFDCNCWNTYTKAFAKQKLPDKKLKSVHWEDIWKFFAVNTKMKGFLHSTST